MKNKTVRQNWLLLLNSTKYILVTKLVTDKYSSKWLSKMHLDVIEYVN